MLLRRLRPPRPSLRTTLVLALAAVAIAAVHRGFPRLGGGRPTGGGEIAGPARVGDGDGMTIGGQRLRLAGIDAPELVQSCSRGGRPHPCGEEARQHLVDLVGGRTVHCRWSKHDKYGRPLATCLAGEIDLAGRMVRDGWAVAYGGYEAEEAEARAARRGLWSGTFEWPEDFRRDRREERAPHEGWLERWLR